MLFSLFTIIVNKFCYSEIVDMPLALLLGNEDRIKCQGTVTGGLSITWCRQMCKLESSQSC